MAARLHPRRLVAARPAVQDLATSRARSRSRSTKARRWPRPLRPIGGRSPSICSAASGSFPFAAVRRSGSRPSCSKRDSRRGHPTASRSPFRATKTARGTSMSSRATAARQRPSPAGSSTTASRHGRTTDRASSFPRIGTAASPPFGQSPSPAARRDRSAGATDGCRRWSPNDREITFVSADAAAPPREASPGLWAVDADGRERHLADAT